MRVSVLLIICRDEEHVTIHENDDLAWSELVRFVDTQWESSGETGIIVRSASEEDRVKRFFAAPEASYIIGNADVSALEAHIGAIVAEAFALN